MPLYDFRCDCGVFEQSRSLQQAGEPMFCPTCQTVAKRLVSAVGILKTPTQLSKRVEQSGEPRVVYPNAPNHSTHKHNHHHGRPWAIGH
ncbi:MAG: zinc ribbon domain-containing protein [Tatlockia sp.]|nr:zinc ribbon domain-containing protein [Tatlockia sp.]